MSFQSLTALAPRQIGACALVSLLVSSLVVVACGGNVVAGTGTTTGNGAGTSSTTTAGNTGNTGNTGAFPSTGGQGAETTTGGLGGSGSGVMFDGGCNPVVAPEQMMQVACFSSTFCPESTDASAREQLTNALGYCNQEKIPCCGKTVIDQVACGPDDVQGNCCYMVIYSTFQCGE